MTELPQALAALAASGADAIFMFDEGPLACNFEVHTQVGEWAVMQRPPLASSSASFAADGALVPLGADTPAAARRHGQLRELNLEICTFAVGRQR